jgi:uncharacterized membrane protein YvbJ
VKLGGTNARRERLRMKKPLVIGAVAVVAVAVIAVFLLSNLNSLVAKAISRPPSFTPR